MFVRSCIPQTRTPESFRESLSESKCQIWSTSAGLRSAQLISLLSKTARIIHTLRHGAITNFSFRIRSKPLARLQSHPTNEPPVTRKFQPGRSEFDPRLGIQFRQGPTERPEMDRW